MEFWLIQFLPLGAAAAILLFLQRRRSLAAGLSVGSSLVCAALALHAVFKELPPPAPVIWLEVGIFQVDFSFVFDNLARLMLLVVTCVGALIHIFSIGYMEEDEGQPRYFGFLSIFMFSMTGVVFAGNFIQMFIFWELVGLSSYLLIGFWYGRETAAQAAKKAFLTNKLGDFGFMLGILCVWAMAGTLSFADLSAFRDWRATEFDTLTVTVTAAALLIFCGAVGKSAQVPLHVWLPDAMEGPTPVSALIHAATMVAAGVYMLSRVYFLISASETALHVITWIGCITAFMSALIAVQQNDIKRILAYSTLSQLGYMVMVTGVAGNYGPGMFHLTTHAFFKALLFLGAGSVIVALHHEQDIWKMGGLARKLRITFVLFVIGALALAGIPWTSGFASKEIILAQLYEHNLLLFAIGLVTAFLTAFYMTRLVVVAFFGLPRSEAAMHAYEPRLVMTIPLIVLAFLSVFGASDFIGVRSLLPPIEAHGGTALAVTSVLTVAAGVTIAVLLYGGRVSEPLTARILEPIRRKFYFDDVYEFIVRNLQGTFAALLSFLDRWILEFAVFRGISSLLRGFGTSLRQLQAGNVQIYAFLFGVGLVFLIWWKLLK